MFRKNIDTFVIALIFVVAAKLLERFHFWHAIGLTTPDGFIFQGLMFLALVSLLHISLFEPYLAIAHERLEQTTEKKKRAEEKKIQANEILKKYEQGILSARMDALKQKERIGLEAENEERERLEAAKQKSQAHLEVAMGEIKIQVDTARTGLIQSTHALVQQLVDEVLSQKSPNKPGTAATKNAATSV